MAIQLFSYVVFYKKENKTMYTYKKNLPMCLKNQSLI